MTLWNTVKFLIRYGYPFATAQNEMGLTIHSARVVFDLSFFIISMLMLNILKGNICCDVLDFDSPVIDNCIFL
jgi:hypothetical protein